MVGTVVVTGIVVAGGDVVVGDAVAVVGTVVVVAVRFGAEAPDRRCLLIFGLTVVVVAGLDGRVELGRVEVGRVEVGRVELGRVVVGRVEVVRAEGARGDVDGVVVVPADASRFDIFRSDLILVVAVVAVVVVLLVVRIPVADVPARYRRRVDPCHLRRRCVLGWLCLIANMPLVVDVCAVVVGASVVVVDVCGVVVGVSVVVDVAVVDGASVPATPGWSARAWFLSPWLPGERVVVVVGRITVVELLGILGAGTGGGGTLVPKEAASAPRAIFRSTTSVVTTICRSPRSPKKVSANLSNCSRCAPRLPGPQDRGEA